MNFYEQEMRSLFENSDIIQESKFCGKTWIGKLDDDLLVKKEFISRGVMNSYFRIQMSIINCTQGLVDQTDFFFSDILGYYQPHATANSTAYHMDDNYGKPKWYTPITQEQKDAIASKVLEFSMEILSELVDNARQQMLDASAAVTSLNDELVQENERTKAIKQDYQRVMTWADIFDKSEMPVKKMIAGYIIKRIDVYADYQLHIELNMTIEQFDLGLDSIVEPENQKLTS